MYIGAPARFCQRSKDEKLTLINHILLLPPPIFYFFRWCTHIILPKIVYK